MSVSTENRNHIGESDGWKTTTIGEAFETATGSTPPKSKSDYYGDFIPFVKPPELCDGEIASAVDNLSESGADVGRILPPESLLVSCIGNLGKIGIAKTSISFNQQINAIKPAPDRAYPKFMFFQALSPEFQDQLQSLSSGTTVPIVNKSKFNSIGIVLPPLPEQERIVGILDGAFEGIATATAHAERNLHNARELFQSVLQSTFEQKGEDWVYGPLTEITTDITDGDHMPPPKVETGVPFITISNIDKETNQIDFANTFRVSPEYFENLKPNRKPKEGDVLYTVTGSFGIPVVVDFNKDFCFQRHIGLLRPKPDINSKWLYYLMLSPDVIGQAETGATGTAQKTVSLKLLRSLVVPKIPLHQQKAIAQKLDALVAETRRLEAIYQRKLDALAELKQSLLQRAFAGEL